MKRFNIPKSALPYFITGLLLTTLTPIIGRYFHLQDFIKGFVSGLGLMLEVIAIVKIQRSKKLGRCNL